MCIRTSMFPSCCINSAMMGGGAVGTLLGGLVMGAVRKLPLNFPTLILTYCP